MQGGDQQLPVRHRRRSTARRPDDLGAVRERSLLASAAMGSPYGQAPHAVKNLATVWWTAQLTLSTAGAVRSTSRSSLAPKRLRGGTYRNGADGRDGQVYAMARATRGRAPAPRRDRRCRSTISAPGPVARRREASRRRSRATRSSSTPCATSRPRARRPRTKSKMAAHETPSTAAWTSPHCPWRRARRFMAEIGTRNKQRRAAKVVINARTADR